MSDVHASRERSTVDTAHGGHPLLSLALAAMMDDVGAHSGAMYLLTPDEPVLEMAVIAGLPRSFAAPWERVALSAPIPVSEAVRGGGWCGSTARSRWPAAIPGSPWSCPTRSPWPRSRWRPTTPPTAPSS